MVWTLCVIAAGLLVSREQTITFFSLFLSLSLNDKCKSLFFFQSFFFFFDVSYWWNKCYESLELYSNHTLAWVFYCKFAACFQNTFSSEYLWKAGYKFLIFLQRSKFCIFHVTQSIIYSKKLLKILWTETEFSKPRRSWIGKLYIICF